MRFALVVDDFLPESTRVGAKMFFELAVELQQRGYQVTIITPYAEQPSALCKDTYRGVEVWRFKNGKIKNVGKIKRALNETLLSVNAKRAIAKEVVPETFDGIVYYSPSIFLGGLVGYLKKVCNCSAYLVLRDMFPKWAIDAGMIRQGSLIEKYFRYFEKQSYLHADKIGLMSQKNVDIFASEHTGYPLEVLRNWASLKCFDDRNDKETIRSHYGLGDKVIFFYGGNIGHAQDMENLMRLVRSLKKYEQAHFLFVGQGDEYALVDKLASDWALDNFTLLPSVDQETFKSILAEIDVGLFSLSAKHTSHNFPGKLLGYMVESKPILGSVNRGNDLIDVIDSNRAGYVLINGDDNGLSEAAITLLKDKVLRQRIGKFAYQLLEREFSVGCAAAKIVNTLKG